VKTAFPVAKLENTATRCEWSASTLSCVPGLRVSRRRNVPRLDECEPVGGWHIAEVRAFKFPVPVTVVFGAADQFSAAIGRIHPLFIQIEQPRPY